MSRARLVVTALAVALLCPWFASAGAPPAHAGLPSIGLCQADSILTIGDTGSSVICLQFALGMRRLTSEPITGVFDQATADAVTWFQATNPPLRVDGQAGPQTLAALGIWSGRNKNGSVVASCKADATIAPGNTGPSVVCLQDTLRELGLYNGSSSGRSDQATVAAITQYQRETPPLQVDGFAGPRTLAAMGIWSGNTSGGTVPAASGSAAAGTTTAAIAPPGPWPAPVQDQPYWNVAPTGIPYYGNRNPCTVPDANMIAFQFAKAGADVPTQQWAVYIASREGNCNYAAVNLNLATQDDSHCTFQLNALAGLFNPTAVLGRLGWTVDSVKQSMENCANAASALWVYCGRGPWTPPYSCRPPWKDIAALGTAVAVDGGGTD